MRPVVAKFSRSTTAISTWPADRGSAVAESSHNPTDFGTQPQQPVLIVGEESSAGAAKTASAGAASPPRLVGHE
jgi:hypothetical protein